MNIILEFEKPVVELEGKFKELKHLIEAGDKKAISDVERLEKKIESVLVEIYKKLTPWEKVQVARHPGRPHFLWPPAHTGLRPDRYWYHSHYYSLGDGHRRPRLNH